MPSCAGQVDDPTATSTNTYNAFGQLSTTINPDPKNVGHTVRDSYTYDALDRRDTKVDTPFGSAPLDYLSSYIGLTPALSRETAPPAGGGTVADVRTYDYNTALRPVGFTDQTNGTPATYMAYALQANGSTQALIDATNTIKPQATYYYDPSGNQQNTPTGTNSLTGPALNNPARYQGFYLDATGQTYNTPAREYQPSSSSFLTPDRYESASGDLNLISDPLTNNRYAYAGGNPTSNTDYSGHTAVYKCSPESGGNVCFARTNTRVCTEAYGAKSCTRYGQYGKLAPTGDSTTARAGPGNAPNVGEGNAAVLQLSHTLAAQQRLVGRGIITPAEALQGINSGGDALGGAVTGYAASQIPRILLSIESLKASANVFQKLGFAQFPNANGFFGAAAALRGTARTSEDLVGTLRALRTVATYGGPPVGTALGVAAGIAGGQGTGKAVVSGVAGAVGAVAFGGGSAFVCGLATGGFAAGACAAVSGAVGGYVGGKVGGYLYDVVLG